MGTSLPAARLRLDEAVPAASGRRRPRLTPRIVAVALLVGAALTLVMARGADTLVPLFAVLSLISLCFAAAYGAVVKMVVERLADDATTRWQRGLLAVVGVLAATIAGGVPAYAAVRLLGAEIHLARLLAIGLAVLTAIRLVELGYGQLRRQVREVELREERAQRQALVARLAALEARVDPHFLFNSLNTVAGLIEEDPSRAVEVVTRLAGFFRHSLQASRSQSVTLADELAAATVYLEIQGLRFGPRLDWSVDIEPGLEPAPVPPFLLQPLVENAVVHGASLPGRRTHVRVAACRRLDHLELVVEDDGPGPGGSQHRGAGTSLVDLGERLSLLYAGQAKLETGPGARGGFQVRVELPLEGLTPAGGGDR